MFHVRGPDVILGVELHAFSPLAGGRLGVLFHNVRGVPSFLIDVLSAAISQGRFRAIFNLHVKYKGVVHDLISIALNSLWPWGNCVQFQPLKQIVHSYLLFLLTLQLRADDAGENRCIFNH